MSKRNPEGDNDTGSTFVASGSKRYLGTNPEQGAARFRNANSRCAHLSQFTRPTALICAGTTRKMKEAKKAYEKHESEKPHDVQVGCNPGRTILAFPRDIAKFGRADQLYGYRHRSAQ